MDDRVSFTDDEGNVFEVYVVEETKINGVNYILVTDDNKSDEAAAYILKDISDDENQEAVYEIVDDEEEIDYIGKIFSELLDGVEIKKQD